MARKSIPVIERFYNSILEVKDGEWDCWEWQKFRDKDGYGLFKIGSRVDDSRRMVRAHRWSYEEFVGLIPGGLQIDHMCCNTCCVNPSHLQIVTQLRNTQLGWERGTHVAHFTPHSEATKEKIKRKAIGRKASSKTRKKMSLAQIGRRRNEKDQFL